MNRNIRFWGNYLGTYLFNLVRLARHYESFDIIYLDGDHSLYGDFAAAIAAVRLLKPGGLFLFGDVRFAFGSRELAQATFRRTKQLTEDEANEPHVLIIIREYLIPLFSFLKLSTRCRIPIGSHSELPIRSLDAIMKGGAGSNFLSLLVQSHLRERMLAAIPGAGVSTKNDATSCCRLHRPWFEIMSLSGPEPSCKYQQDLPRTPSDRWATTE
ncbi:hypothetical protein ABIF90_007318 [Bradyrhizobium japonicum]